MIFPPFTGSISLHGPLQAKLGEKEGLHWIELSVRHIDGREHALPSLIPADREYAERLVAAINDAAEIRSPTAAQGSAG